MSAPTKYRAIVGVGYIGKAVAIQYINKYVSQIQGSQNTQKNKQKQKQKQKQGGVKQEVLEKQEREDKPAVVFEPPVHTKIFEFNNFFKQEAQTKEGKTGGISGTQFGSDNGGGINKNVYLDSGVQNRVEIESVSSGEDSMFFTQTPLSGEENISVFKTSTNTSTETLVNDSNSDNNGTSANHGNAAGSLIFGVADGVGGWNDVGISPSVFARTLTSYVKAMSKFEWKLYHREPIDIKNVVRRAFTLMKLHHQSDEVVGLRAQKKESNEEAIPCCGSSTIAACELQLDTGELTTGVLGDSTYSIFQLTSSSESPGSELESNTADEEMGAGEIVQVKSVFNSTEQQHRFNMPYQLCIPPTQEQIQRQKYRKNQKHMYQNESGDKRVEKESANDIRMARNSDSFGDNEQYIGKTGDGRAANGGERQIEDVVEYYSPKMEAITHQVLEQLDSYTFDHEAKQGLDTPNDMVMNSHELGNNSLVLMATDGLFDNVAVAEIETLMESHMQNMRNIQNMQHLNNGVGGQKALGISDDKLEQMVMQQLTADIVKLAIVNYASKESTTPFSERAKQAGYSYTGGKPDDVTIVLCWLKEAKGDKKDNGDGRGGGKNSIDSDRFNFKAKL